MKTSNYLFSNLAAFIWLVEVHLAVPQALFFSIDRKKGAVT
ncbi:hypothetical protein D920_00949 [Enterococcus faecalis 13-SD-W-01]|nr:hypothetical protein D920_00949 [Enterococcus faecalis 13-SD-W-01]